MCVHVGDVRIHICGEPRVRMVQLPVVCDRHGIAPTSFCDAVVHQHYSAAVVDERAASAHAMDGMSSVALVICLFHALSQEEVRVGALVASNGFFAVWSVLYGELFAETIVEGNGWLHVPAEPAGCIEWGEDTARGCLVVNALPLQGSSSLFTVTQWIALCVVALLPVVAWSRSYQALDRIAPMLKYVFPLRHTQPDPLNITCASLCANDTRCWLHRADWSNNGPSSATWQLRGHR